MRSTTDHSRSFGAGILDPLRFVKDRHRPLTLDEILGRAEKNVVGRQNHPAARESFERTGRTVEEPYRQVGRESLEQSVPVFEHPARAHHDRLSIWVTVGKQAQQAHDLVSFAETHVVGEQRAHADQVATP
jgi:hypothetical protein